MTLTAEGKTVKYPPYHPLVMPKNRARPRARTTTTSKLTKPRPPPILIHDSAIHIIQHHLNKPLPPLPPEVQNVRALVGEPRPNQSGLSTTSRPHGALTVHRADTVKLKILGQREKLITDLPLRQLSQKTFFSSPPSPFGLFSLFDRADVKNGKEIRERIWELASLVDGEIVLHGYRGESRLACSVEKGGKKEGAEEENLRALSRVCRKVRAETGLMFFRVNKFVVWHDADPRLEGCKAEDVLRKFKGMIGEGAFSRITTVRFGVRVCLDALVISSAQERIGIESAGRKLAGKMMRDFKAVVLAARQFCFHEQTLFLSLESIVTVGRKQLSVKEEFDLRQGVEIWRSDTVRRWLGEAERERKKGREDASRGYEILGVGMRGLRRGLAGVLPVDSLL